MATKSEANHTWYARIVGCTMQGIEKRLTYIDLGKRCLGPTAIKSNPDSGQSHCEATNLALWTVVGSKESGGGH